MDWIRVCAAVCSVKRARQNSGHGNKEGAGFPGFLYKQTQPPKAHFTKLVSPLQAFSLPVHPSFCESKLSTRQTQECKAPTSSPPHLHHSSFSYCPQMKFSLPIRTYKGLRCLAPAHLPSPAHLLQFIQKHSAEPSSARDLFLSPSSPSSGSSCVLTPIKTLPDVWDCVLPTCPSCC